MSIVKLSSLSDWEMEMINDKKLQVREILNKYNVKPKIIRAKIRCFVTGNKVYELIVDLPYVTDEVVDKIDQDVFNLNSRVLRIEVNRDWKVAE